MKCCSVNVLWQGGGLQFKRKMDFILKKQKYTLRASSGGAETKHRCEL